MAGEEHHQLRHQDTQEHAQGIDGAVAQRGSLLGASLVGVGQCRGVGVGAGQHTHDGVIVELIAQACDGPHNQDGDDGDKETRAHIHQAAVAHGVPEGASGLDAHAGQEKHQTNLTQHHVGRGGGVGDELEVVAETADEDGHNQGTSGQTELQRYGHTGNGDGKRTENQSHHDADKYGGDVGSIEAFLAVAHQLGHTVHVLLGTHGNHVVANLEMVVAAGVHLHALSGDASEVDAVDAAEVHLAQHLAVHLGIGDGDAAAHHGSRAAVSVAPLGLYLGTDEGDHGIRIGFGTNEHDLVSGGQHGVAHGGDEHTVVQQAGDHHVAVQELADLHQRAACDIAVLHTQVHHMGLYMGVGSLCLFQLLVLLLQVHAADVAHGNGGSDDAKHAKRIGTGITVGNLRHTIRGEDGSQRLVGGTQTGRVGDSSVHRAHHHGQAVGIIGVKEQIVAGEHHSHVEQNGAHGQQIELNATLFETLEEAGTHLQAYAEDKENEAEILDERECGVRLGRCQAQVTGKDAHKQDKADTQRDAANLNLAQVHAKGNNHSIEQGDVGDRSRRCEQVY